MDETISFITQNDGRYNDPVARKTLRILLKNKAIECVTECFEFSEEPDLQGIAGPQKDRKFFTRLLFEKYGVTFIGYEVQVPDGIADVMGKMEDQHILVECGPCRMDKVWKYLHAPETELWLVNDEFRGYDSFVIHLMRITRGPNWRTYSDRLESHSKAQVAAVKGLFE